MQIAIDTEYGWKNYRNEPFVCTVTTDKMKTKLYNLRKKADVKKLKKLVLNRSIEKIFHNAPSDITALDNVGIKVFPPYHDTMTMANIINENFESKSLKALARIYLGIDTKEDTELRKIKSKLKREAKKKGIVFTYDMIPPEILYPYAKKDTEYTMRLFKLWEKKIRKYQDIYDLECSIIPIICHMQKWGMRVDRKFLVAQMKNYNKEIDEIRSYFKKELKKNEVTFITKKEYKREPKGAPKKIGKWDKVKQVGDKWLAFKYEEFNPNSIPHVSKALKAMGVDMTPILETDKHGNEKEKLPTDMASLEKHKQIPFVDRLLRYRFITKQLSTYYLPLHEWYTGPDNDRAHFAYYQSGAKSGRFSAELVQTIPRREDDKGDRVRLIRNAFIPAKGYSWVAIDYDQIEMRLFAHFSNNALFIDNIRKGLDPHWETAYEIWTDILEPIRRDLDILGKKKVLTKKEKKRLAHCKDVKKSYRKKAKGINFGVIYGMGVNLLAESLKLPTLEAREALSKYNKRYRIREYMDSVISSLYTDGFVSVCLDSPRMHIYREYRVPQDLAYKAVNIIVQGTASYVMRAGMKRAWRHILKNRYDIRMLGTIHDELVFEVNNKYDINKIMRELVDEMNDLVTFKVPIIASPKFSKTSWGDAKDVDLKKAA